MRNAFQVAIVMPVIHDCMGRLKINGGAEAMDAGNKVVGGQSMATIAPATA